MNKTRSIAVCVAASAALCAILSQDARADTAAVAVASSEPSLEQIVVTARRREENAQQVPIKITVLDQQTLKDNNVETIRDLQYVVPSLSLTTPTPNECRLTMRGQGAVGNNSSGTSVAIFLNEVPTPSFPGGVTPCGPGLFFDLQNVQVLAGPQGTLFGANSVGGDILLQAAPPTKDFGGKVQVSYGNYNDTELDGAINIPLVSDVLLSRVAFNGQVRDGYTHLEGEPLHPNGIDADNRDNWALRATLSFRPNDVFQNDTILAYSQYQSRQIDGLLTELFAGGLFETIQPTVTSLLAQQQAAGVRTAIPVDVNEITRGYFAFFSNVTRVNLTDTLTLKNLVGYNVVHQEFGGDSDATALPLLEIYTTPYKNTERQLSEELQLQGSNFDKQLQWVVGSFYQYVPTPAPGGELATYTVFGSPQFQLTRFGSKSQAPLYAQGTYDLSSLLPGLKFTGGARYTEDEFYNGTRIGTGPGGQGSACTVPYADCAVASEFDLSKRSHAVTWTAGIDYQAAPGTLLYLTSRKGYRGAGYNRFNAGFLPNPPGFGPEFVTDLELGVKSDWNVAGRPIRTNADIWGQDYSDIQVQEIGTPYGAITQNAAKARLFGAEVETLAQVTDALRIGVNFDYLTINYTSFNPLVPASAIDDLNTSKTLSRPRFKYGLKADYRLPIPGQDATVRAIWNWQSSNGDTSVPQGVAPAFGLLNLAADWNKILGGPLDVSLFASNALNKTYTTQPVPSFEPSLGYGVTLYGEPRMYGVRVRYRFGEEAK